LAPGGWCARGCRVDRSPSQRSGQGLRRDSLPSASRVSAAVFALLLGQGLPSAPLRTPAAQAWYDRHGCGAVRRGNSRVLLVARGDALILVQAVSLFYEAGWEVGVIMPSCGGCDLDSWVPGNPRGLRYVRRGPEAHALEAAREWLPSLVIPSSASVTPVLHQLLRDLGADSMAPAAPRLDAGSAAIACSQPPPQFWGVLARKGMGVELASALGVPVPWSVRVTAQNLTEATTALIKARLPLYIKTNFDGAGLGVGLVKKLSHLEKLLRRFHCSTRYPCALQSTIEGYTTSTQTVAVDGRVLGAFSKVKVVTKGVKGISYLSATYNNDEAVSGISKVLWHIGYTGIGSADFMVSAAGRSFLIDPNMRLNVNAGLDAQAIGLGVGLFVRLREAITGGDDAEGVPQYTYAPLPHAVTFARVELSVFIKKRSFPGLFCEDVFLPMPWDMSEQLRRVTSGFLRPNATTCTTTLAADVNVGEHKNSLHFAQACTPPLLNAAPSGVWAACGRNCVPLRVLTPAPGPAELGATHCRSEPPPNLLSSEPPPT